MITLAKILLLRRCDLFSRVPLELVGRVASVTDEVCVPAGTLLFSKGDPGDGLYLVVEGDVRIHLGDRTLRRIGVGEYFGEVSLIDGEPRSACATTEIESTFLRLSQPDFLRILTLDPEATLAILRVFLGRFRRLEETMYAAAHERMTKENTQ